MDRNRNWDRMMKERQWGILIAATGVVAAAFCLEVVPDGRVAVRGWERFPLPHSCATRELLGVRCPGCGLTRSLIHLAHGRWRESLAVHRFGWLVAGSVLLQFPYRLLALWRECSAPWGRSLPRAFVLMPGALLILNWLYEAIVSGLCV